MQTTVRQRAIDDLLEHGRTLGHTLNTGRQLAPVLLGRGWCDEDDDEQLVAVLHARLGVELTNWEQTLGLPPLAQGAPSAITWLRDERVRQHRAVETLVFVWAVYVAELSTAYLAQQIGCSTRRVQQKTAEGRKELTRMLAQPVTQQVLNERSVGVQEVAGNGRAAGASHAPLLRALVPSTDQPVPAPPQTGDHAAFSRESRAAHPSSRHIQQQIRGSHNQAVSGPVHGSVTQSQTHYHYYGDSGAQPRRTAEQSVFGATVLLSMVGGYWLIQTMPWYSVTLLLLLTGWRVGRQGWHLRVLVQGHAGAEECALQVSYVLAWIGALFWAAILAWRLQHVLTTEMFSFERLLVSMMFVGLNAYVVWLGTLDLLVWVYATDTRRWPWRLLYRHATSVWEQRWVMIGITWLMLVVFSIAALLLPG